MIFNNETDDRRAREAFETLGELCENHDELYLLVAVIRMFHQVKDEYRQCRAAGQPQLHIVKH